MDASLINQILITVGALALGIIAGIFARGKNRADAASSVSSATIALLKPLEDRLTRVSAELEGTEKKLKQVEKRLEAAVDLLEKHGISVPWQSAS